jgi:hypothetical protein
MSSKKRWFHAVPWFAALVASTFMLGACGSIRGTSAPVLSAQDSIGVVSMQNFTETPAAGSSVASIAAGVLRAGGLADVRIVPRIGSQSAQDDALFDTAQRELDEKKLAWAREHHLKYVLTGAVEEWRYKAGVDGEPVAGITLELIDTASGRIAWSATGTRTGWSRSSLSSVASALIGNLLAPLHPRS